MATVKKVKKYQNSGKPLKATADATRVEKPIVKSSIEQPTYKNLKWVGEPTKDDSLSYKKGYIKGIAAKKKGEKNTSNAFGTSAGIRGFQEGYNKNRNGGVTKAKDGKWIQKATASIKKRGTEGKCTPITKPGCTGRAKALAKTFKKMAKARKGK